MLLGFLVGLGPALMAALLALAVPELWWLYEVLLALAVIIPVCLFIALVRYLTLMKVSSSETMAVLSACSAGSTDRTFKMPPGTASPTVNS